MCFYYRSSIRLISVVAILLWCSTASALTWSFAQSGYAEGAAISGSFTGVDINLDNRISASDGEVSAFSVSFSGNSVVDAWTGALADLSGLVYDVGTPFLGDDPAELITVVVNGGFAGAFLNGETKNDLFGGRVGFNSTVDNSASMIAVTLVPEPSSALLIAIGLAGLGWRGRAKHA
jgi:hypothetical protein